MEETIGVTKSPLIKKKNMQSTNTLAYFAAESAMYKRGFVLLHSHTISINKEKHA
jgi:hypothetical protein